MLKIWRTVQSIWNAMKWIEKYKRDPRVPKCLSLNVWSFNKSIWLMMLGWSRTMKRTQLHKQNQLRLICRKTKVYRRACLVCFCFARRSLKLDFPAYLKNTCLTFSICRNTFLTMSLNIGSTFFALKVIKIPSNISKQVRGLTLT